MLRRARGYAPLPVQLAAPGPTDPRRRRPPQEHRRPGGRATEVFLCQHLGDMETPEALAAFERVVADFLRLYDASSGGDRPRPPPRLRLHPLGPRARAAAGRGPRRARSHGRRPAPPRPPRRLPARRGPGRRGPAGARDHLGRYRLRHRRHHLGRRAAARRRRLVPPRGASLALPPAGGRRRRARAPARGARAPVGAAGAGSPRAHRPAAGRRLRAGRAAPARRHARRAASTPRRPPAPAACSTAWPRSSASASGCRSKGRRRWRSSTWPSATPTGHGYLRATRSALDGQPGRAGLVLDWRPLLARAWSGTLAPAPRRSASPPASTAGSPLPWWPPPRRSAGEHPGGAHRRLLPEPPADRGAGPAPRAGRLPGAAAPPRAAQRRRCQPRPGGGRRARGSSAGSP